MQTNFNTDEFSDLSSALLYYMIREMGEQQKMKEALEDVSIPIHSSGFFGESLGVLGGDERKTALEYDIHDRQAKIERIIRLKDKIFAEWEKAIEFECGGNR